MVSFDVLKGAALALVHLQTLFFDQLSFPRHMHGNFDILGSEHLGRTYLLGELDLKLRERLRLAVLDSIGAKSYPDLLQKSLSHIFEPLICWQGSQGTISAL